MAVNASRNGVATITRLLAGVCRVSDKYGPSFSAFVSASTLDSTDKAAILACIATIQATCEAFRRLAASRVV
jgi:hypothetical protein